jgi:precorrin-6Y C5,15-methyltransferase (decarboxylating)
MNAPPPWLTIIGIGEDFCLTPDAASALSRARFVVGGARHLALAAKLITGETMVWPTPLADAFPIILAHRPHPVAVLASGDPYCYGVGTSLGRLVPMAETLCYPEKSAFTLACARLGWAFHTCDMLSLCGRPIAALRPKLQPGARILALSADSTTPASVAHLLVAHGYGPSVIHVLEALGGPRERIRATSAETFCLDGIQDLNLLAIEAAAAPASKTIPLVSGLADDAFAHDGQLTKREIRAVTLSSLAPCRGELLWDVGSGAGSIAIEWMLSHPANRAIAIERDAARADRIRHNAQTLGVPSLQVVHGIAPAALSGLPTPDAVFIGGGAHDPALLDFCHAALPPGGRLVVNAVTLETQSLLFDRQRDWGGTLTRLSVERLDDVGSLHAFRPAMAVVQYCGSKP